MKKMQLFGLLLTTFLILLIPNNIKAKEVKVICKYQYQNKELVYSIYNNKITVPFEDGKNNWYHGQDFTEIYLESLKSNNNYICPTITIEESATFTTIFNNPKNVEDCNGKCTTISAINDTQKAVDTTAISSIGIYNDNKYFIPYFRILDDGTTEWSINGKKFIPTDRTAIINVSSTEIAEISLDKKLINEIYKDNKLNSNITIYRNVKQAGNKYYYLLSTKKNDNYNLIDGQENSSASYHASLGDGEGNMEEWLDDYNQNKPCLDDNSILGSYNDPNSVAYFLKIIFDWLKLLGPFIVVVMSGIDFAKVIIMGDDDGMKKAQSRLIIRLILAVSLFFLPDLISALLELFNITSGGICEL